MTLTIPLVAANGAKSTVTLPDPVVSTGTTTFTVGQMTIGTITGGGANTLYAQPITLPQAASLQSLTFNSRGASGQVRLGLYSGTTPTTLIAQTAVFTPVDGWNTVALTSPQLPAGQYWLAHLSSSAGYWAVLQGGPTYYKTITFGAMPATFPTPQGSEGALAAFYGTFSTAVVVPDTTPPSIPTNVTATNG